MTGGRIGVGGFAPRVQLLRSNSDLAQEGQVSDLNYLNRLRVLEMEQLISLLPSGGSVLEFGAGTGQQARILADRGFDVVAVDMASSTYASHRSFPVQDYDGRRIPLNDQSVDVVFSSNVLEHVEDLSATLAEFRRVLRPGGTGIHVMPTTAWRFWTFITAITDAAITAARLPVNVASPPEGLTRTRAFTVNVRRMVRGLTPSGHGTSPEGISELWTFSARAWRRKFEKNGYKVITHKPMGIFYSGNVLLGLRLPFASRSKLSRIFGSSMRIYVVQPI